MICIDIGNKQTTIYDGKNSLTKLTTVKLLPHDQIQIGLPRSIKHVVYDIVALLGIKYQDQQFTKHAKFYFTDFWKNKWGKIDIGATFQEGFATQTKCIITQTLLALFLRKLLIQFLSITNPSLTLASFLSNTKFYITVSGQSDHPSRYALKQACQIAGIQSPVFIYSTHAIICSYYQQNCKELQEMEEICLLEFGDRGAMVSVYRIHSFQDRIVEVLECKGMRKGGYHLTKVLAEYIIEQIKQEKGIDISRHNSYMSLLHSESENVKIIAVESEQKQAHMRIPNLPDDSTFGRIITQKLLTSIIQKNIEQVIALFKDVYKKYKQIKTVLISGRSCNLGGFQQKIIDIVGKGKKVRRVGREEIGKGVFQMQKQEIVLFDISDSQYEVIGQENFHRKLMDIGQNIPERRQVKAKFPAGELQFNLKVLQNGIKIGHFILDSRPAQLQFELNFQIDRNKLIGLHVKTEKGKIDLITNFEGIPSQQVINQAKRISQYKL